MNNHLDKLIERAIEKRHMNLHDFIMSENLEAYELGYEDILYADELNIAKIPHEEYMILLRQRLDSKQNIVVEYAIYSQEDHDNKPLYNSLNMNATYHFIRTGDRVFCNMADAISEATDDIYDINLQNEAIVRDMTDNDPLADLTFDDASQLISEAKAIGYDVPASLTPTAFIEIYNNMKQEEK